MYVVHQRVRPFSRGPFLRGFGENTSMFSVMQEEKITNDTSLTSLTISGKLIQIQDQEISIIIPEAGRVNETYRPSSWPLSLDIQMYLNLVDLEVTWETFVQEEGLRQDKETFLKYNWELHCHLALQGTLGNLRCDPVTSLLK